MITSCENPGEGINSPDEETRRLAVMKLRGLPPGEILPIVAAALGDESWRVRKEAVEVVVAAPSELLLEELVRLLRSDENAGLRNSSAEALIRTGSAALPVLHRYVADPDHDVRKFILDVLGEIADPSSIPVIAGALGDEDLNVRAAAAENLGKIGTDEVLPHLLAALQSTDTWLRYSVLEALAAAGRPVSSAAIIPLASDEILRKAVFDCLGIVGNEEAVPVLVAGLAEKSRKAREAAARGVARIRSRLSGTARRAADAALASLRGTEAVDAVLPLLEKSDIQTREAAVAILGAIGDSRTISFLLHGCHDELLRPACIDAFREIAGQAPDPVIAAYDAGSYEERALIVYLCGDLRLAGTEILLHRALRDTSPSVRNAAAIGAGKSGMGIFVPDLLPLLDDPDPEVCHSGVEALTRLASQEREMVLRAATPLAASASPEKRTIAATLFGACGDAERLSLLVKDDDPGVRRQSVAGLARLRLPECIGSLVMALADEDPDVRISAAEALGAIGGEEVIGPLQLALQDEDPWLKCAALRGLGRQGVVALAAVSSAVSSEEGMVRIVALEALAEIGGPAAEAGIRGALDDPDEEVVRAAVDLLGSGADDSWVDAAAETLLRHPHWEVRGAFFRVLAEKRGADALPLLRQAFAVEDDELVRTRMKEVLEYLQ